MVVPFQHTGDLLELDDNILLDMQKTIRKTIKVMRKVLHPHAMNIGLNMGRMAGAGIDEHIHYHIVPRWDGDTNFMPVIGDTKVVSESLDDTWKKLHDVFLEMFPE
jgi:ATP adenylyltransferase